MFDMMLPHRRRRIWTDYMRTAGAPILGTASRCRVVRFHDEVLTQRWRAEAPRSRSRVTAAEGRNRGMQQHSRQQQRRCREAYADDAAQGRIGVRWPAVARRHRRVPLGSQQCAEPRDVERHERRQRSRAGPTTHPSCLPSVTVRG